VTFESRPTGPDQTVKRPTTAPEAMDVLRRMPTRTGSWLSAVGRSGAIVQAAWEHGTLWLETPNPADASSTGKHASLEETERMLVVLATDDRSAVAELDGATTRPWR
jgi:hypothetical protein